MPQRTAFLGLVLPLLLCLSANAQPKQTPPNIVFIFSDDHAYQAISAYGLPSKLLDTPNIDRIAKGGMRFDRCVVPNSLCGPSRACVLTGKYNHINGFYNNTNSRFDGAQFTFPKLLQKAGYQTAIIGKWHLVSNPTGFDYWNILPGQGVYYNPPMIRNGQRMPHQGYVTDLITEFSLDWLKHRDKSKPFLLMCQHKAPHREWDPALRHLGHDKDRNYPLPDTFFDDYAGRGKAEHVQDMMVAKTMNNVDLKLTPPRNLTAEQKKKWDAYYEPRNKAFREANLKGKELVQWKFNRYMHDYLGCIKAVDESVGQLLDYLDQEKLSDNTIVVYCADQGFYLGEHGWFDKRWIFEESLRTPLVVRWPGKIKPGSVNNNLVSNIDFADVSGCRRDRGSEGRPGPQPGANPERTDAGRLAEELLLPLLRASGTTQCGPALRRGDGSIQACTFLRTEHGLLGTVRSQEGSQGVDERLRPDGIRCRAEGLGNGTGAPA